MKMNAFELSARAMSAQLIRLNTVASNLANSNVMAASKDEAYKPLRAVFKSAFDDQFKESGRSTVDVDSIVRESRDPARVYMPSHPLANDQGFVFRSPVDTSEEMVEMMEARRQYQNNVEVLTTMRKLMSQTLNIGR